MSGGGLNRFDPISGTFTKYLTKPLDAAITTLSADAAGNLWLGTASEGVIRWNPEGDFTVLRATPGDDRGLGTAPIIAILVSSTGKVWIGSDGDGLLALDPGTGKFTRYRYAAEDPGTISDDHITVLFEDRNKNLWIGPPMASTAWTPPAAWSASSIRPTSRRASRSTAWNRSTRTRAASCGWGDSPSAFASSTSSA